MASPPYVKFTARMNESFERAYELPRDHDDADRQAFVRWLLEVTPTSDEFHTGRVRLTLHQERVPWHSERIHVP